MRIRGGGKEVAQVMFMKGTSKRKGHAYERACNYAVAVKPLIEKGYAPTTIPERIHKAGGIDALHDSVVAEKNKDKDDEGDKKGKESNDDDDSSDGGTGGSTPAAPPTGSGKAKPKLMTDDKVQDDRTDEKRKPKEDKPAPPRRNSAENTPKEEEGTPAEEEATRPSERTRDFDRKKHLAVEMRPDQLVHVLETSEPGDDVVISTTCDETEGGGWVPFRAVKVTINGRPVP